MPSANEFEIFHLPGGMECAQNQFVKGRHSSHSYCGFEPQQIKLAEWKVWSSILVLDRISMHAGSEGLLLKCGVRTSLSRFQFLLWGGCKHHSKPTFATLPNLLMTQVLRSPNGQVKPRAPTDDARSEIERCHQLHAKAANEETGSASIGGKEGRARERGRQRARSDNKKVGKRVKTGKKGQLGSGTRLTGGREGPLWECVRTQNRDLIGKTVSRSTSLPYYCDIAGRIERLPSRPCSLPLPLSWSETRSNSFSSPLQQSPLEAFLHGVSSSSSCMLDRGHSGQITRMTVREWAASQRPRV